MAYKQQTGWLVLKRKPIIFIFAVVIIMVTTAATYYFGFYNSHRVNPIVGEWRSAEPYFGQTEYLTFVDQGKVVNGSLIDTSYKIDGDIIWVKTHQGRSKYTISKDYKRLFIHKPRVGKLTFNRVGAVPKELLN